MTGQVDPVQQVAPRGFRQRPICTGFDVARFFREYSKQLVTVGDAPGDLLAQHLEKLERLGGHCSEAPRNGVEQYDAVFVLYGPARVERQQNDQAGLDAVTGLAAREGAAGDRPP